jgi:hypothetical protein
VISALSTAFAQDDLTVEEFERRVDIAHRTSALSDLNALLADLPAPLPVPASGAQPAPAPAPALASPSEVRDSENMVAIMGGVERHGAWVPARQSHIFVLMGGAELDFREARLAPGVTEVTIVCAMGGVEIVVPPGLTVDVSGIAIMGGFGGRRAATPADASAPLLRVNGFALMGGVDVDIRLPGESAKERARRERKERKRLKRGNS